MTKINTVGTKLDEWVIRAWPSAKKIVGECVDICSVDVDADASALFEAFHVDGDLEQWNYLGHGPFDNAMVYRKWLISVTENPLFEFYAILAPKAQKHLGLICFTRIRPEHGSIEIAHVHFSNAFKRSRGATEVIYLLLSYVFDDLGYRRCEWKCDALNEKSRRAAKRFGFIYEGTFRQDRVSKGRNRDTTWFSMTDKEWPGLKKSYQEWLKTSNFDSKGKQLTSLRTKKLPE